MSRCNGLNIVAIGGQIGDRVIKGGTYELA